MSLVDDRPDSVAEIRMLIGRVRLRPMRFGATKLFGASPFQVRFRDRRAPDMGLNVARGLLLTCFGAASWAFAVTSTRQQHRTSRRTLW